MYIQFIISEKGIVSEINTRAPDIKLKKHIEEIIRKLPQLYLLKKKVKMYV